MNAATIKGLTTKLNKQLAQLAPGELLVKENLHADVYHGCEGVSTSKLKLFMECPAKYKARFITGEVEQKESKAFDVGKGAHGLILEPHKWDSEFILQPSDIKVRRGKAWDAFKEKAGNKVVLTADDWEACHGMRDAVAAHHFGSRLLSRGRAEVSYFKRDEETGLIIKCRPDYEMDDLLVDVKTAMSSNPAEFARKAKSLMYHVQDAIYRDITGKDAFAFLAVEKEKPYVVTAPLHFDDDAVRLGHLKYRKALNDLALSIQFNHFEGYTSGPAVMSLKPWERHELEQLEAA